MGRSREVKIYALCVSALLIATIFSATANSISPKEEMRGSFPNYAILIEGGAKDNDSAQECFHRDINYAYEVFTKKLGYPEENVRVLYYPSKKEDVKDAINWLKNHSTKESDCFIYLRDHGQSDGTNTWFCLNPDEFIKPWEFKKWIKDLKYHTLTIFIECCHSGGFLRDLEGKNRIIITSTDRMGRSYRGMFEDGKEHGIFGKVFFDSLSDGKTSYGEAWEKADAYVDFWFAYGLEKTKRFLDLFRDYPIIRTLFLVRILLIISLNQPGTFIKKMLHPDDFNPKIDDSDKCDYYGNRFPNKLWEKNTLALKVYPVPQN